MPCVTCVTPLVDTLMFCPGALDFPDDEDEELESDGLAAATHGIAAIPTPIPSATASAPTRPMISGLLMMLPSARRVRGRQDAHPDR